MIKNVAIAILVITLAVVSYQYYGCYRLAATQHARIVADGRQLDDAVTKYNAMVAMLGASCKGVAADADQEPTEIKMGCFFGAMADARDQGQTEGQVRTQVEAIFTPQTDEQSRDFMLTLTHRLYSDMSHMNRYEVQGAVRIITIVWDQTTGHN
jgi:hypothetical protein